jgi:hypothetical protein
VPTYAYDDFRVTLTARADGAYDARAVDRTGTSCTGVFRLPFDDTALERAVLALAHRRTRKSTPAPVPPPKTTAMRDIGASGPPVLRAEELGGALADALLTGEIGARYDTARREAAARGRGLRLTLSLTAAPALLSVPWELLYRRPRFFANQRRTPLVRHLETTTLPDAPTIDHTVRILGVVASPADLTPLDVAAERGRVEQAVASVVAHGLVELDWLAPATPRRLRQALRDGSYHVLHFVGHSDFTSSGDGVLYLEGSDGGHAAVYGTELANLLADQTRLRLVVLNSCEGARTTLTDPFAGVATTLVQLGVPAIVAMQFEISDEAAILFAEELYTDLIGRQDPIDAAVAEARKALYIEIEDTEWATPVLFMADPDVELFHFEVPPAPVPPPRAPEMIARAEPAPAAKPAPRPAAPPRRRRRAGIAKVVVGIAALGVAFGVSRVLTNGDDTGDEPAAATAVTTVPASGATGEPGTTPVRPAPDIPASGRALPGSIDAAGEEDVYTFGAQGGDIVYIKGSGACGALSYQLQSPDGSPITSTDVCYDSARQQLAGSGTHRVVVSGQGAATGRYRLTLLPVRPDRVFDVDPPATVAGEIKAIGANDVYTFDARGGDIVYLQGSGACGALTYQLQNPDGSPITATDVCYDSARQKLAGSGTHRVVVSGQGAATGRYRLTLLPVRPDRVVEVDPPASLAGEIKAIGANDVYTFAAQGGDIVYIQGSGACGALTYQLQNPDGSPITGTDVCYDVEGQELPGSGTHRVVVSGQGANTGRYQLRLTLQH